MHTYLLSDADVVRYAIDFVARLQGLGDNAPKRWFTLGTSGDKIVKTIAPLLPQSYLKDINFTRLAFDRKNKTIVVRDGQSIEDSNDDPILIIDSAVHSGASMSYAVKEFYRKGYVNIITYSLIVKNSSLFVPNFFGMLIGEHDRALFQLESLPNNRLQLKKPFGTLRAISDEDVHIHPNSLDCGVPSLDKISFSDLLYSVKTQKSSAYLLEVGGRPAGFVHFYTDSSNVMHIDAIANDKKYRGKGIGGALMRWAETYARSTKCLAIELWAIDNRVPFYQSQGYKIVDNKVWDLGGGEKYIRMRRLILYNLRTQMLFA